MQILFHPILVSVAFRERGLTSNFFCLEKKYRKQISEEKQNKDQQTTTKTNNSNIKNENEEELEKYQFFLPMETFESKCRKIDFFASNLEKWGKIFFSVQFFLSPASSLQTKCMSLESGSFNV